MAYLEELLPEFRKGARIRKNFWDKEAYIYYSGGHIFNEGEQEIELTAGEITRGYWELYQELVDWDYIINNKCLCQFWDSGDEDNRRIGLLTKISRSSSYNRPSDYLMNNRVWYEYCRPVRRDEVTFYEDKEK